MASTYFALFKDSADAGRAVSDLKEAGFTKEISVLARDAKDGEHDIHRVKEDAAPGTAAGAAIGAATGALAALTSGITALTVPGIGLLVGGPLIAALGLGGGAAGALSGGLVGGLLDLGMNEPAARMVDGEIKKGHVLVGVSVDAEHKNAVRTVYQKYDASEIETPEK